jgi:hypothetical protein
MSLNHSNRSLTKQRGAKKSKKGLQNYAHLHLHFIAASLRVIGLRRCKVKHGESTIPIHMVPHTLKQEVARPATAN